MQRICLGEVKCKWVRFWGKEFRNPSEDKEASCCRESLYQIHVFVYERVFAVKHYREGSFSITAKHSQVHVVSTCTFCSYAQIKVGLPALKSQQVHVYKKFDISNLHVHVPTFKFTTALYKVGLCDIGIIISRSYMQTILITHIVA